MNNMIHVIVSDDSSPFKEMENGTIVAVAGKTVVYDPWLRSRKARGFGVDCFQGVGVLGVGIHSTVDAELVFWDRGIWCHISGEGT